VETDAYILFFLLAIFISFLINWILLKFSKNLGVRNNEELKQIRWSKEVKPSLGGLSFFIVFLISTSVLNIVASDPETVFNIKMIGILSATTLGFVIGLADDAYNTNPLVKFIGQLTCAFILILSGIFIDATTSLEINYALTVLWVVGLMNSINMLDNMDGITTSISMSIILVAVVIVGTNSNFDTSYLILLLGVLGALTGFLYFNWNPAKIYMGDSGSQFLGVFLAATSMVFFWNVKESTGEFFQIKQFVIPMLVFIIPLIDTATVSIRRLMRKQSPFVGGKDHTTHHLVFFGLSEKQTALLLLFISLLSLPIVLALYNGYIVWTFSITALAFAYFFLVFGLMQVVYNIGKKRFDAKRTQRF
jgi:UDP-GlcNAc:undecaprenyl-phosphate/decaprenyl-phosphate GlcNAc-1-phosphate transferase